MIMTTAAARLVRPTLEIPDGPVVQEQTVALNVNLCKPMSKSGQIADLLRQMPRSRGKRGQGNACESDGESHPDVERGLVDVEGPLMQIEERPAGRADPEPGKGARD
jgi:hypothetical protein